MVVFKVGQLHSGLSQTQRVETLSRFKNAELDLLISTDLAARGLDIEGVLTVNNSEISLNLSIAFFLVGYWFLRENAYDWTKFFKRLITQVWGSLLWLCLKEAKRKHKHHYLIRRIPKFTTPTTHCTTFYIAPEKRLCRYWQVLTSRV